MPFLPQIPDILVRVPEWMAVVAILNDPMTLARLVFLAFEMRSSDAMGSAPFCETANSNPIGRLIAGTHKCDDAP